MKKNLLILIAISATFSLSAQERENRTRQGFSGESEKMSKATGWAYNNLEGVWIDYQNIVSDNSYKNYPSLKGGDYHKSNSKHTFESLQFKKYVFSGKSYYVLFIDKICGAYRYPSIHEDWEEYSNLEAYVFDSIGFNNFKNYQVSKSILTVSTGRYDYQLGEEDILNKLQTNFGDNKEFSKYSQNTMVIKRSDDGKFVRFLLPEYVSEYSKGIDFTKNYFEVTVLEFDTLSALK